MKLDNAVDHLVAAFGGKLDKSGTELARRHSLRVAAAVESYGEDVQVVAVLHDVIEDTTHELTIGEGDDALTARQATALLAITRLDSETYKEYIQRCMQDPIATVVKIADIKDNMGRPHFDEKEKAGLTKKRYKPSLEKLTAANRNRLLKVV